MFEYLKTKQEDTTKRGTSYSVAQQRAIPDRNGYADRFAKPEYYPVREMESVVQRCYGGGSEEEDSEWVPYEEEESEEEDTGWEGSEEEDSEEDDNPNDPDYVERTNHQYLDPVKLRRELGATGNSGEAHHIIPGNIVERIAWVNDRNKDHFNKEWNGIMLHGTKDRYNRYIHRYKGNAPKILHRLNNRCCHDNYDNEVRDYIDRYPPQNINECIRIAKYIRNKIENPGKVYALDNLSL